MKPIKVIQQENGRCTLYGGRTCRLEYGRGDEECFRHMGRKYCLSDFMVVPKDTFLSREGFDGYLNDSYFSGVAIKLHGADHVKAYTFICG